MTIIDVFIRGASGFIVAVTTPDREPTAGYAWDGLEATAVIVGQVHHSTFPKDTWTAWLWKQAGCYPATGVHCTATEKPTVAELAVALRKRHDEKGPWWGVSAP